MHVSSPTEGIKNFGTAYSDELQGCSTKIFIPPSLGNNELKDVFFLDILTSSTNFVMECTGTSSCRDSTG